jgi:hypothetical protein
MALPFVYLAFCATLRLFARRRDEVEREAELLVLRHAPGIAVHPQSGTPPNVSTSRAVSSGSTVCVCRYFERSPLRDSNPGPPPYHSSRQGGTGGHG